MKIFPHSLLLPALLVISFIAPGCAEKQLWYNPGKTQADFDRDAQECEVIAREMAGQATMTGKMMEYDAFATAFNSCLNGKGWFTSPPPASTDAAKPTGERPPPLASQTQNNTFEGFGLRVPLPDGFSLLENSIAVADTMTMQRLFFQRPDNTFVNLVFQKMKKQRFIASDFPVQEPFFLYEQGKSRKSPDRLRWAASAGQIQGEWVALLGGYIMPGKEERLTVVVTVPLPAQSEAPPPGLRLTRDQKNSMEKFIADWLPWLQQIG